jgi:hypothetical protein
MTVSEAGVFCSDCGKWVSGFFGRCSCPLSVSHVPDRETGQSSCSGSDEIRPGCDSSPGMTLYPYGRASIPVKLRDDAKHYGTDKG